jgi:cell division initiation protein
MSLSPVEVRHLRFPRRPLGLSRRRVQRELERVAEAFEDVWRERADLGDRVEELEGELRHHRELEEMLRKTLVSAERASDAMRENARREASTILRDSEARAREIIGEAHSDRERVRREALRIRDAEREFRSRFRSVVASTVHLVEAYEAELPDEPGEDPGRAA